MTVRDFFGVDAKEYASRIKKYTDERLRKQEMVKTRQTFSASMTAGGGIACAVYSSGCSLLSTIFGLRRYDVAQLKLACLKAEIKSRGLPDYKPQKRDYLIPVAAFGCGLCIGVGVDHVAGAAAATIHVHCAEAAFESNPNAAAQGMANGISEGVGQALHSLSSHASHDAQGVVHALHSLSAHASHDLSSLAVSSSHSLSSHVATSIPLDSSHCCPDAGSLGIPSGGPAASAYAVAYQIGLAAEHTAQTALEGDASNLAWSSATSAGLDKLLGSKNEQAAQTAPEEDASRLNSATSARLDKLLGSKDEQAAQTALEDDGSRLALNSATSAGLSKRLRSKPKRRSEL